MRNGLAALAITIMFSGSALAADAEGQIATVDQDAMTITLEDGETYKLPAEIDMTAITEGLDVLFAYRKNEDGEKQITDMVLPE